MKNILSFIFILSLTILNAQTKKVAILDFEITSNKTEYNGLGKALSNMLITDLKNNIHPKKVQFYERGQLNKILDEQNLQKSKEFDKKTAVDFGKLSGSDYVFVGSLFVLEGTCNISSRLVDVQTSEIVLTKDVSGKIEDWLSLKSQLGEGLAQTMNQPLNLDGNYKTQKTNMVTLNQYAKLLSTMDAGDSDKAEQYRSLFEETNPEFKYFTDLKDDIEELKKQVEENTEYIVSMKKNEEAFRIHVDSVQSVIESLKTKELNIEDSLRLVLIYDAFYNSFVDSLNIFLKNPGNGSKKMSITRIYEWCEDRYEEELAVLFQSSAIITNPFFAEKMANFNSKLEKATAIKMEALLEEQEIPVKLKIIISNN